MPKVDWNAPGLYYLLKYREVPDGTFGDPKRITDPALDVFAIPNPGYYKLWEFQIRAGNKEGEGPWSPVVQSYSGQDRPKGKPGNVQTGAATARTVELSWQPVTVTRGSVDGYKVRAASSKTSLFPFAWSKTEREETLSAAFIRCFYYYYYFLNLFSLSLEVGFGKVSLVTFGCVDIDRVRQRHQSSHIQDLVSTTVVCSSAFSFADLLLG